MPATASRVRDQWLLPILEETLSKASLAELESALGDSYWEAAVASGSITDEWLLALLSKRAHMRIAEDLFVTQAALDVVPENRARRYRILPLDASPSRLEIATANPYDIDCERTLGFWSGRAVGACLAAPGMIAERIDAEYSRKRRASLRFSSASE